MNFSALLTGKALEVYFRLPVDQINDYTAVKSALLERYRLTEEGFRQKFFTNKAEVAESAAQFMTRLESYLDRWMQLSGSNKTYDDLKELFIREQFVGACHKDLTAFLRERKHKQLQEVIEAANNYREAHGGNLSSSKTSPRTDDKRTSWRADRDGNQVESTKQEHRQEDVRTCFKCHQKGHLANKCTSKWQSHQSGQHRNQQPRDTWTDRTCFLCDKKGHLARDCRAFDKAPQKASAAVHGDCDNSVAHCQNQCCNFEIRDPSPPRCDVHKREQKEKTCDCKNKLAACLVMELQDIGRDSREIEVKDGDGKVHSLCHMLCDDPVPLCQSQPLPTVAGRVNFLPVTTMRDTGCCSVVVKSDCVDPTQYTGNFKVCLLVDGTTRKVPTAIVFIDSPYYTGKIEAMVMPTPPFDVIVGNIPGVRPPDHPAPDWQPTQAEETQTVITSTQAAKAKKSPTINESKTLKLYQCRESPEDEVKESNVVIEDVAGAVIEEATEDSEDDLHLLELGQVESHETYLDVHYADTLSPQQLIEAQDLVYEYRDIFSDVPDTTNLAEHKIELTTAEPTRQKPYPLPYATRQKVREEVEKMLEAGIIERTESPYAAPVVLVKKSDGSIRFCIDYRKLNRITIFDGEPMTTADDIFATLQGDKYFSKVDLAKGYWQVPIREGDRQKTAFVTPDGSYQFRKMPFGLVNATATFNRLMRKATRGIDRADSFVDDLLGHTPTWNDHMQVLRKVFEQLREGRLRVRPTKCHIGFKSLTFLGHQIQEGALHPHPDKVEEILQAPNPTTKRQVRSFLGLVGYYRSYIPNFSTIAAPLTDLTKKGLSNIVRWGKQEEDAFQQLKAVITQDPILKVPDFNEPFVLQTDASGVGAGAALLQEYDGIKFPVAYSSKKFSKAEKAYSVIERECLALVWGLQKFQTYLYGKEFVVETDHQPLIYIDRAKVVNSRIMRWALLLQNYRFHICAIRGKDNVVADYLSRAQGDTNQGT